MVSRQGGIGDSYHLLFGVWVIETGKKGACPAVRDDHLMRIVYLLDVWMQSEPVGMSGRVFSSKWPRIYVVPYWQVTYSPLKPAYAMSQMNQELSVYEINSSNYVVPTVIKILPFEIIVLILKDYNVLPIQINNQLISYKQLIHVSFTCLNYILSKLWLLFLLRTWKKLFGVKLPGKAVLKVILVLHLPSLIELLRSQIFQHTGMRNNHHIRQLIHKWTMLFQNYPKPSFELIDPNPKLMKFLLFTACQHLKHELFAAMRVQVHLFLPYLSRPLQNLQHPSVLNTRKSTIVKMRKLYLQLSDTRADRPSRIEPTAQQRLNQDLDWMMVTFEQKSASLEAPSHGRAKNQLRFVQIDHLLSFFNIDMDLWQNFGIDKCRIEFELRIFWRLLVVRILVLLLPVLFSNVVLADRVTNEVAIVVWIIHSFIVQDYRVAQKERIESQY